MSLPTCTASFVYSRFSGVHVKTTLHGERNRHDSCQPRIIYQYMLRTVQYLLRRGLLRAHQKRLDKGGVA